MPGGPTHCTDAAPGAVVVGAKAGLEFPADLPGVIHISCQQGGPEPTVLVLLGIVVLRGHV
eukprot:11094686-Alexandrium_andersonii.AAC.1